jgi:hypothetical protein
MTEDQKTRLLEAGDAAMLAFQKVRTTQLQLQIAQKAFDAAEFAFLEVNGMLSAILDEIKQSPADRS